MTRPAGFRQGDVERLIRPSETTAHEVGDQFPGLPVRLAPLWWRRLRAWFWAWWPG